MDWISRNIKWIAIVLFILFLFKNVQSCNRRVALNTQERRHTELVDSLRQNKNSEIDSLKGVIIDKNLLITNLETRLEGASETVSVRDIDRERTVQLMTNRIEDLRSENDRLKREVERLKMEIEKLKEED